MAYSFSAFVRLISGWVEAQFWPESFDRPERALIACSGREITYLSLPGQGKTA
jgi:hypothetical protein